MVAAASPTDDGPGGIRRPRWHPLELTFWIAPLVAFVVMSDRRLFLSQVFIYGLLALSLDLILGYAGILSLGQAAFFGVGAYTAGLLARHGWPEALLGLGAAGLVAGAFGYAASFLVVRGADLTRLMVTLGIGLLTAEAANQASSITGGVDGLADMQPATLFGTFSFGLDGKTAFLYSFVVLALMFVDRAPPRPLAVRPRAARDPRERAAHARNWCGCGQAPAHGLRARGRDGRHGRRAAGADHRLRGHRHARLPALRRAAHHPGVRRHGAPLRRAARRGRLHRGAGRARRDQPRVLAVLAGRRAGRPGAGGARRADGRARICCSDGSREGWGDGQRAEDGAAAAQLPGLRRRRRRVAGYPGRRRATR